MDNCSLLGQMLQATSLTTWSCMIESISLRVALVPYRTPQDPYSDVILSSNGCHPESQAAHLPPGIHRGNPDDPLSRAYKGSLLEKIVGHEDSTRIHHQHLINLVKPMPTFKTSSGELVEIFFGTALKGTRCPNKASCAKMQLCARGQIRHAPEVAVVDIIAWLKFPKIKARIRLSYKASRLLCFWAMLP